MIENILFIIIFILLAVLFYWVARISVSVYLLTKLAEEMVKDATEDLNGRMMGSDSDD